MEFFIYRRNIYKNYNYFLKTQIICTYIEGFLENGLEQTPPLFRRVYFSHLELSWSASRIQLFIYVYNSSTEYFIF